MTRKKKTAANGKPADGSAGAGGGAKDAAQCAVSEKAPPLPPPLDKSKVLLPGLFVDASGEHQASVILLHGLGDYGQSWYALHRLLTSLGVDMTGVRWIAPSAAAKKMLGEVMPGWFTYKTDNSGEAKEDEIVEEDVAQTRSDLHKLMEIEAEALKEKGGMKRVMLVGSSQGGCMAIDAAVTAPETVGGVIMMRSLPMSCTISSAQKRQEAVPLLLISGDKDETFLLSLVKKNLKALVATGAVKEDHQVVSGLDHDVDHNSEELCLTVNNIIEKLQLSTAASTQSTLGSGIQWLLGRNGSGAVTAQQIKEKLAEKGVLRPRDKAWDDLTDGERLMAKEMGINCASSWDEGDHAVWAKSWDDLTYRQRTGAKALGFSKSTWEPNQEKHGALAPMDKDWKQLTEEEKKLANTLGIKSAGGWDNCAAPVFNKYWNKLTKEQQRAASKLGFDEESWNDEGGDD